MDDSDSDSDNVIIVSKISPGYIISLENLDIDCIPIPRSESLLNSGPKVVKIFVKSDDNDFNELEMMKCFICDVEVAAAFFENHLQSLLHQAYAKIAKTALERNREPQTVSGRTSSPSSNLFYCTFCSCVVEVTNIQTHANTEKHRVAVKHAKLISALALLYEDKNNYSKLHDQLLEEDLIPVETKYGSEENKTAGVEEEKKTSADTISVAQCEIKKKRKRNKKAKETKEITKNVASNGTEIENVASNGTEIVSAEIGDSVFQDFHLSSISRTLQDYLSNINAISDYDVEYFDLNHVEITISGYGFKIDLDKFHGFKYDECKKITICQLCELTIVSEKDYLTKTENYIKKLKRKHSKKKQHIVFITEPVSKDCIRQFPETWKYHCLVCNEVFGNFKIYPLNHIINPKHNVMINAAILENKKERENSLQLNIGKKLEPAQEPTDTVTTPVSDLLKYYCSYCKFTSPNKKAKRVHNNTNDHRFNEWFSNYEKGSVKHFHLKPTDTKNTVLCTVCHETIKGSVEINEHVETKGHMQRYAKFLEKNLMRSVSDRNVFCNACCVHVSCLDVVEHCVMEEHKTCLAKGIESNSQPKISELEIGVTTGNNDSFFMDVLDENRMKCKLCNISVNNKLSYIITHTNTHEHTAKYDSFLQNNQLNVKVVNNIFLYYCKVCQKDVSKTAVFGHTSTSEHITNLLKIIQLSVEPKSLSNSVPKEKAQESVKEQKQYLMVKIDENILECQICKTELFDKDIYILEHINSVKHKAFYESLLLENEIKKSENFYFCNICKKKFLQEELKHIYSTEHKNNFTKNPLHSKPVKTTSEYFCKICNVNFIKSPFNIKMHEAGSTHKTNLKKLQQPPTSELIVKNSTEEAHPSVATNTKTNEAAKAAANTSTVNDVVNGFCQICQTKVPNNPYNIEIHVKGSKHMLAKLNGHGLCNICKVKVPNNPINIREHLNGTVHKNAEMELKNRNSQVTKTQNILTTGQDFLCTICKVKTPNNPYNIREHLNGTAHKNAEMEFENRISQVTKAQNTLTTGQEFVCTICKVKIPNNLYNIREHLNGTAHKNAEIKLKNSQVTETQNSSTVGEYVCDICQVKVPNNPNNIREHLNGTVHKNAEMELKNRNSQVTKTQNILTTGQDFLCTICKVKTPNNPYNIREHLNGTAHKNAEMEFENRISQVTKAQNTLTTGQEFVCTICKVKIPNNLYNIREHLNGTAHKNAEIKLKNSQVTETQNSSTVGEYVCDICQVKVPNNPNNIREHVNGSVHKKAIQLKNQKQNMSKCDICNVWYLKETNHIIEHMMCALDAYLKRWEKKT